MRIDRIEPSRRRKDRVLVFLEGGDLLRVTEQELLVFGLRPGLELPEQLLAQVEQSAKRSEMKARGARLTGSRMLSKKQVMEHLTRKGGDRELAEDGVQECIVIAQDITRYGVDLYGERRLPELLRELCRLPFHWVRLHYLYPDNLSDELIDTIAGEAKICNYLDIPIQHCNDTVLKAMRRRETKAGLEELFRRVRERIPGVVLRTSLITGLPYEDEAAFEELCDFLGEQKLQRVGAFPYSPEEGTPAARMLNRVDTEEAQRRAELVMEIQTQVMDEFNDSRMGDTVEVLCDGYDVQAMSYVGRSYAESPGIDGCIFFTAERDVEPGDFVMVRITGAMDGDLTGEAVEELSEEE